MHPRFTPELPETSPNEASHGNPDGTVPSSVEPVDPIRRHLLLGASRTLALAGAGGAASLLPPGVRDALAQSGTVPADWPARPPRFIVPFPPGGPVDTLARHTTAALSEVWGKAVLVDNRAGAGGILGADVASRAPADGLNFFVCAIHHAVLPSLKKQLPYDIRKDFVPVSFGAIFPVILVANPQLPVKTMAELVEYARANPGKLAFGSAGNGGGTHLAGELFKELAGVDLLHVPYKGSAPAMTDVLAGVVQLMFADAPTALPQMRAGKVRALGVATPTPSSLAPDVPPIGNTVKGYEAYSWAGFLAPKDTPEAIVNKVSQDIRKALEDPKVKENLLLAGAEAAPGTPAEFARFLDEEITKWARVVQRAGIQAD